MGPGFESQRDHLSSKRKAFRVNREAFFISWPFPVSPVYHQSILIPILVSTSIIQIVLEEIPLPPPRRCIWCGLSDGEVPFRKRAHSIPQGLGGQDICENVCDHCNEYFGNKKSAGVSIEEAIKETFHISRLRFLY